MRLSTKQSSYAANPVGPWLSGGPVISVWRRCALPLALLLVSSVVGESQAQPLPPELTGQSVVEIALVSLRVEGFDVRSLGVPIGARLGRGLLRRAVRRLVATERWADVQLDVEPVPGGVRLLVHLAPRIVLMRVDLFGNAALSEREVSRALGVRAGETLDAGRLGELQARVEQRYRRSGYRKARVRLNLRQTNEPGRQVLRVAIDEGPACRIRALYFDGDALPGRLGLADVFALRVGDRLSEDALERALQVMQRRLRAAGYFSARLDDPDLRFVGKDVELRLKGRVGPHHVLHFHGYWPLERGLLATRLDMAEQGLDGEVSLGRMEKVLTELYRRHGFHDVEVEVTTMPATRGGGSVRVKVDIRAGRQLVIERLSFPGAKRFDRDFLSEQIYSYLQEDLPGSSFTSTVDPLVADAIGYSGERRPRGREMMAPPDNDPRHRFHRPTYAQAERHIRELYRGSGHLDVEVGPARLVRVASGRGRVEVPVKEGPRSLVYDVTFEGRRRLRAADLLRTAGLRRGQPFSYLRLEEARLRLVDAYKEEGYFYIRIESQLRFSEDRTRVAVGFVFTEGPPVRVAALELRGANRSSEEMIRDRVRLRVGDLYRPSVARASQDTLQALDVFTSVSLGLKDPEDVSRAKTVVVSVQERPRQFLGWGGGFSTGEGARGAFEYGYRNLFGQAIGLSFRAQLGYQLVFLDPEIEARYGAIPPGERVEYQAVLAATMPYLPGLPQLDATLNLVVLQDLQRDFRLQKEGIVGSLVYRPQRRLTLTLSEELESSDFLLLGKDLVNIGNLSISDLVPEGENALLSTSLGATWDLRDRAFNPRSGLLLSLSTQWARTLQDDSTEIQIGESGAGTTTVTFRSNLLRMLVSAAFYLPFGRKVVLAGHGRYGRVIHLDPASRSYPNRQFYLGGVSLRGFYENQMIPQDLEDSGAAATGIVSRGGDTFIALQTELRFPLVGDVFGAVFVDAGNLWRDPSQLDLKQIEPVAGLGLRFQTPVASLGLDYGVRALRFEPFGYEGALQFSFQRF